MHSYFIADKTTQREDASDSYSDRVLRFNPGGVFARKPILVTEGYLVVRKEQDGLSDLTYRMSPQTGLAIQPRPRHP